MISYNSTITAVRRNRKLRSKVFNQNRKNAQKGFSLIELMIAVLIGIFLIGGLIGVFIASSNTYRVQQAQTEVQQLGQYALRWLNGDINRAGFQMDWEHTFPPVRWLATDVVNYPATATNILEVYWRDSTDGDVNRNSYYQVNDALFLRETDDVLGANVFIDSQLASNIAQLNYRFAANVHDSGDEAQADIDWLPRPGIGAGSTAYIDETEYTIMVAANSVSWHQVKAISLDLVIASATENITDTPQVLNTFNLDTGTSGALPTNLSSNELRLYKGFTSTISIRNRIK